MSTEKQYHVRIWRLDGEPVYNSICTLDQFNELSAIFYNLLGNALNDGSTMDDGWLQVERTGPVPFITLVEEVPDAA